LHFLSPSLGFENEKALKVDHRVIDLEGFFAGCCGIIAARS
jgi:hypothetical protein